MHGRHIQDLVCDHPEGYLHELEGLVALTGLSTQIQQGAVGDVIWLNTPRPHLFQQPKCHI